MIMMTVQGTLQYLEGINKQDDCLLEDCWGLGAAFGGGTLGPVWQHLEK